MKIKRQAKKRRRREKKKPTGRAVLDSAADPD
jgi:hypothetical protein